jgi:enterochelin esterase-like enzyme
MIALVGLIGAGCGGGGGDGDDSAAGSMQTRSIVSSASGITYPLFVYVPPDSQATRATLPVIYVLDGESRFWAMVDVVTRTPAKAIVVAIGNQALRNNDYVPANLCTQGGGGQALFLETIRSDVIPFVEANFGGDPRRRILLGHSHGGSFVLYALFNERPADRLFSAYLASDASIACMEATVYGWESTYAAANTALPVRLHVSHASNVANVPFADRVQSRNYGGLTMVSQFYAGGHLGMIPLAFADAVAFALA